MRTILTILVSVFTLQMACLSNGIAAEVSSESVLKDTQRRLSKKQVPKQVEKLKDVEPRKLISDDSTKALKKWLEMEKDYKKIKNEVEAQNTRLEFFKERLNKAKKVAELYKEPGKDPDYLRDQKEAQESESQASKNHEVEAKKLEQLKSELAVSEKRYNIAEKAYKIYNPSLSGFTSKGVAKDIKKAPKVEEKESKEKVKEEKED